MNDPYPSMDSEPESTQSMLGTIFDISGIEEETNIDRVNEAAFELYKEAACVVFLSSHLFDEEAMSNGGWNRNQAICGGLIIRIYKLMHVVVQLSAERCRGEIVLALNRSILETSINLEFLLISQDETYFDRFVTNGLGPERELYDQIQSNIGARNGHILPIEYRMLSSIKDVCDASGVEIGDVDRKHKDWSGGGVRSRLQKLGKEEWYTSAIRVPSHAVHGDWVDVYKHHLEYNDKSGLFKPKIRFDEVDERQLGPIALIVLDSTVPYLERYFNNISDARLILERIFDLSTRLRTVGETHERLMNGRDGAAPTGL